jgi:hypothetical protein
MPEEVRRVVGYPLAQAREMVRAMGLEEQVRITSSWRPGPSDPAWVVAVRPAGPGRVELVAGLAPPAPAEAQP